MQVMAHDPSGSRVDRTPRGREQVLPTESAVRVRILPRQRVRKGGPPESGGQVIGVLHPDELDLGEQGRLQGRRQQGHPILATLAASYADLAPREPHVLHAQAQGLHQPHAGAVEQPCQQARVPESSASSFATSSRDRTVGRCTGRFARRIPAIHGRSTPSTSR